MTLEQWEHTRQEVWTRAAVPFCGEQKPEDAMRANAVVAEWEKTNPRPTETWADACQSLAERARNAPWTTVAAEMDRKVCKNEAVKNVVIESLESELARAKTELGAMRGAPEESRSKETAAAEHVRELRKYLDDAFKARDAESAKREDITLRLNALQARIDTAAVRLVKPTYRDGSINYSLHSSPVSPDLIRVYVVDAEEPHANA